MFNSPKRRSASARSYGPNLFPAGLFAQHLNGLERSGIAVLGPKLFKDASCMNFDRVLGATQNRGDVAIGFSLCDP
jgi:hypothetical protein